MKKQYKVGIYCRLSVDDASNSAKAKNYIPGDESASIENQHEILSKFVMLNGWIEVKTYRDDGYSGGNFQRPGFLEMLEDARHGLINLILVKDLSRLGRDFVEVGRYTDVIFPSLGCRFVSVLDCLDEECTAHFQKVQDILTANGIAFTIDPKIVRGLDYYTRTVFEFVSDGLTVCGGGRYDNLVEEIGGKPTGAVGFGLGIERLIMILEKQHGAITETPERDVYIGSMGEKGLLKAQSLTYELRKAGIQADCDTVERSVKAQMKYANKLQAQYAAVLGEDELNRGVIKLRNMAASEEREISLETLAEELK